MLTKERVINLLREQHFYLAAKFGVSRTGLSGSHATGHRVDASEIDLIIESGRPIGPPVIELKDIMQTVFAMDMVGRQGAHEA